MDAFLFRKAAVACASAFALAALIAGCGGGGSSTPSVQSSSSPSATNAPIGPSATATYSATNGAGPFALPAIGSYSGTLNESVVSAGASHASVPLTITDYSGSPSLPSGFTISTGGLNVFFSFAETFGSGTTGDSVSLGNPFSTTLTIPASLAATPNVVFFSQLCYYTPSAPSGSQFSCDPNSLQSQSISGTTLTDTNPGAQFATSTGSSGLPTASIPYGTTIYKLFFSVSASATPTPGTTTGPLTTQATTVPLSAGSNDFALPGVGGYTAFLNESVAALSPSGSTTMLITASNGLPSPLPSGVSFNVNPGTLFYTISQQVAPDVSPSPGASPAGSVTFATPLSVTLVVPAGAVPLSNPVYSEVCYYDAAGNPTFVCDPSSQQIANVNAATNTIVDTNHGVGDAYWTIASSGNQTTATQAYGAIVYKFFYYPTATASGAVRAPSVKARQTR